jgi:hypothetical protein
MKAALLALACLPLVAAGPSAAPTAGAPSAGAPSAAPATQPIKSPSMASEAKARNQGTIGPDRRVVRAKSIDGTDFPPLRALSWWESGRLPQIGTLIGSLPGDVPKIVSLHSQHSTAARARQTIGNFRIEAREYDWVTTNVAGCSYALLKLDEGRVSGVCLIGSLTTDGWQRLVATISSGGIREGDSFRVGRLNYRMRTSGNWSVDDIGEA